MNNIEFFTSLARDFDPEEKEFRAWLKNCREILADRGSDEIAYLARLAGFPADIVLRVLSNFRCAMEGTIPENKLALHLRNWEKAMADFQRLENERIQRERPKELDLMPLWKSVAAYQMGGTQ